MPILNSIARDLIVLLTIIMTQHNNFHKILLNSDHETLYVIRVQFVIKFIHTNRLIGGKILMMLSVNLKDSVLTTQSSTVYVDLKSKKYIYIYIYIYS